MYITKIASVQNFAVYFFFIWVFFHGYWWFTGRQEKGGYHIYFSVPLSPAREQSDIYLQLCIGDDPIVLIASLVITRDAIWLVLPSWKITICLIHDGILIPIWWFNSRFYCGNLTQASCGFELESTITLVLQASWETDLVFKQFFNKEEIVQ